MKKEPSIRELFDSIQKAEALLKIYDRQKQELLEAALVQTGRVKRLQSKIDVIQAAKEDLHLSALDRATQRSKEFPATLGRRYKAANGTRFMVQKEVTTGLLKIMNYENGKEYMAGYDAETLAMHFFYIHPEAIVVGASR